MLIGSKPNKNHLRSIAALNAFSCLVDVEIKVFVVSDYNDQLRNAISTSHLNITHLSHITDFEIDDLYSRSNVLLFPSLEEGFGLPILEAQQKKLQIITTNAEPFLTVSGRAAYFCNPYSTESIVDAICAAYSDYTDSFTPHQHFYINNLKNYSPSIVIKQMNSMYDQ